MNPLSATFLPVLLALAGPPLAGAAQVDFAKNSVRGGATPAAAPGTPLASGDALATGRDSRTQISLGSKGSVMRAGSKTEAVLLNDTALSLRQGIMMASSGRGTFGREGITVDTPETKTTVKGTMLVAYQPQTYIKITCIEGQVTVRLKALMGEFVSLREGQMLIINPAEKRLPDSVEIDLQELVRTSVLLGADFPALASTPRFDRATERQARVVRRGEVIPTPLILSGAGLSVSLQADSAVSRQREPVVAAAPPPAPAPRPSPPRAPSSGGGGAGVVEGPEYIIDGTTVFGGDGTPALRTPGYALKEGTRGSQEDATIWMFPDGDARRSPELLIRGETRLPSTSQYGDLYVAVGELRVGDSATTSVLNVGELGLSASGLLHIDSARIATAADSSSSLNLVSGTAVRVARSTIDQTSGIQATAPEISVQQSSLASSSLPITLASSPGGAGITITDSSQLRSLASSIGIALLTHGAPIAVRDSQLSASHILIDTVDPAANSLIDLRNATLNGDLIRARGFNTADRDALVISGSTINAADMIKFYAEGSSRLRFQGNVDLNLSQGGNAILAGRIVQVDEGGAVRVRGDAQVYRDIDNYNKNGYGTITATGKQADLPYGRRPAFDAGRGR